MYLKSIKFRFTFVYSLLFIIGAAALYAVSYFMISTYLRQEEEELLRAKMLQFWAVYQTGRTSAVQQEFAPENLVTESTAFFVRIASRDNGTVLLFHPRSWQEYNLEILEETDPANEAFILLSGIDGSRLKIATARLFDGNYLQLGVSNRQRVVLLGNLRRVYLLVSIPFIVLGIAGGWLVASRGLKPIKQLSTVSRFIIETGELSRRIPSRGSGDELDELTDLFNRMLERIDVLVTGMRSSLDNVAHDLRTPMTRIRMKADEALRRTEDPEGREAFRSVVDETDRILQMLKTLMDISGAETGVMRLELERVDFAPILEDIVELYSYSASEKSITIDTALAGRLPVQVDVNRIRQVVANLLDNAVKYTDGGGAIELSGHTAEGLVQIEVRDSGHGIDPEDLPRISDRLYRGDKSRSEPGLGLGLGLVKAIVEAHGGEVSARSPVNPTSVNAPGSVFRFSIPIARDPA